MRGLYLSQGVNRFVVEILRHFVPQDEGHTEFLFILNESPKGRSEGSLLPQESNFDLW